MRQGSPIEHHHIQNSVNAHIQFSMDFLEYEACIAAGLDIVEWDTPISKYSNQQKAKVVAWYELHNEVKVHQQDALNRKEEQMQKRAARKKRR